MEDRCEVRAKERRAFPSPTLNLDGLLPKPVHLSPAELSGCEIEGTAKDCLTPVRRLKAPLWRQ